MTTVVKAKKSVIFKTIYEFCKSDINVVVEALDIAKRLGFFTADDLHVLDPSLEKMDLKPQVYGTTIKTLLKDGKIKFIRYVPSSRRVTHGRPIGEYEYLWG
jgi:hypothetical protein